MNSSGEREVRGDDCGLGCVEEEERKLIRGEKSKRWEGREMMGAAAVVEREDGGGRMWWRWWGNRRRVMGVVVGGGESSSIIL